MLHFSKVKVDVSGGTGIYKNATKTNSSSSVSSNKLVDKLVKIVKWMKWVFPLTVVVHSVEIYNSQIPNYEKKMISLDSLTLSMSSLFDNNMLVSKLHLNLTKLMIGDLQAVHNCKWTLNFDTLLTIFDAETDVQIEDIKSAFITQGMNIDVDRIQSTVSTIFSNKDKKPNQRSHNRSTINIDLLTEKIRITGIYFGFADSKFTFGNTSIDIKDTVFGFHLLDKEHSAYKRYSNLIFHKFTSQLTGLTIQQNHLKNTKQFIEFTNFSSLLDLKCIAKIILNIDNTEMIKTYCSSDDSFIARSYLTLTNFSCITTIEDILLSHFLSKKKSFSKKTETTVKSLQDSEILLANQKKQVQRLHNILMVIHKVRTRIQCLSSTMSVNLPENITLLFALDDFLFDSSFSDNISSLFNSSEDSYTPTKAIILFSRNLRFDIMNDKSTVRILAIQNIKKSLSLGIDSKTDQMLIHDADWEIDEIEVCITDIHLIKKINTVAQKITECNDKYDEQLFEYMKEMNVALPNIEEKGQPKKVITDNQENKPIVPKFVQKISACIKSIKFVSCFQNPVKYYDGIDFTEMNSYKRGIGLSMTDLSLKHDNTIESPTFDVQLKSFIFDIFTDFKQEANCKHKFEMLQVTNLKLSYEQFKNKLSVDVPDVDVKYSVEALWSILFVKTVLTSVKTNLTKRKSKGDLENTPKKKEAKNNLNLVFKLHLLKMHLIMPSDVELAIELDSLVYSKQPQKHDYSVVSFRAFRIYGQNPHIEGMWTLIMIWDNIKMKIKDASCVEGEEKVDMMCNAVRIEIPYEYVFYEAFDNLKALLKTQKIITHNFKDLMSVGDDQRNFTTSRLMPSIVKDIIRLPKIRIRSNHFIYCNHDDPFEEELTSFFTLGKLEQRMRIEKVRDLERYELKMKELLQEKYSPLLKFENGEAIIPVGYKDYLKKGSGKAQDSQTSLASPYSPKVHSPFFFTPLNTDVPLPMAASDNQDVYKAWEQYKTEYHQSISVPRSRLYSNLSKSWIKRIKTVKQYNTSEFSEDYFRARHKKNPGVKKSFFRKFPIVLEGNNHPLFGLDITNLDWTINEPAFGVDNFKEFMKKNAGGMPTDMKYGIFFPMNWKLGCSHMRFQIKDYPLPMIGFGSESDEPNSVVFNGDFVVFEQEFTLDEIRYNYVPLVSQYDKNSKDENLYALHIPRTMTTIKIVTDLDIHVDSCKNSIISWSPALQPGIRYAMDSFDLLSKPPIDISPKVGFWDKFPLMLHGKAIFHFKSGLDLFIKGSLSPYDLVGRSSGLLFRWSDDSRLLLNSTAKSEDLLIVESNTFELGIPVFGAKYYSDLMTKGFGTATDYKIAKSVLKLTSKPIIWKLGFKFERNIFRETNYEPGEVERTRAFRPHYDVRLKNPITFANEQERESWDSYEGWRSDYMFLALSIHSKDETGHEGFPCCGGVAYNSFGLTPLTVMYFLFWWDTFKSSLGLPIKEGKIFQKIFTNTIKSPKFGQHLFGISYSIILSPLYLAHVYRHISADEKVAFTGIKCFVKSFQLDMHQSKEKITLVDKTTKELRSEYHLKMNQGVVDFVDADFRILTAVFNQKHDIANLNMLALSPETTGTGFPDSSSTGTSEFINDRNWYDKNDYIELEATELPQEEPKWRMLALASSPRFYYIRDQEAAGFQYPFDDIEKATHECLIGTKDVIKSACDLADLRVAALKDAIDIRKSMLNDLKAKPLSEKLTSKRLELQTEMDQLKHRLHVVHRLKDNFQDGIFPEYDQFANDLDESDTEPSLIKTQSNALSRVSSFSSDSGISRMKSRISTAPIKTSSYKNRFIVYSMSIKWTSHTRSGFLSYLEKVKDRRFLVFSMSQKAVNLAEDLCKSHLSIDSHDDAENNFKNCEFDPQQEFVTGREVIDDITELLHTAIGDAKVEDSFLLKFILPQISCSMNSKDCVLVASNSIVLRNISVEESGDGLVSSTDISAQIEQRTAITVDDAFVYVLNRNDLINGVYNLFNTNETSWPPVLPLEMYYSPVSMDKAIVLQSLSFIIYMVEPNELHYSKNNTDTNNRILKSTTKLVVPDVQIVCDSKQFNVLKNIFTALTTTEKSQIAKVKEAVKSFVQFSDFNNYNEILEKLVDLQNEVRKFTFCKRILISMTGSEEHSTNELNIINAELERLHLTMNAIADFLRTLKTRKFNDSKEVSVWSIVAPSIQIRLIDSNENPFVEVNAVNTAYKLVNAPNGSSWNIVNVMDFILNDRHPNALYDTVLSRLDKTNTDPLFSMEWQLAPAVGGISVLVNRAISFSPLRIAVDTRMTSELQKFLFPGSTIINELDDFDLDDFDDSVFSDLDVIDDSDLKSMVSHQSSSSLSSKKSGLKKTLSRLIPHRSSKSEKASQINSSHMTGSSQNSDLFNTVVIDKACEDSVTVMKDRAKKYFSARHIVFNPTKMSITFKGQGKLSLVNLSDFTVTSPKIEITNMVLSNEELFAIIKTKMVRTVLQNSFSLIKSKFRVGIDSRKQKKNSAKPGYSEPTTRINVKVSKDAKNQTHAAPLHHHHHHHSAAVSKDVDLLGPRISINPQTASRGPKRHTLKDLVANAQDPISDVSIFKPVEEVEEEELF